MNIEDFDATIRVSSPGRINLIGDHTDYNDCFVLPMAIDKKIEFYFKKNSSENICNIKSSHYKNIVKVDLNAIKKRENTWENYILGVIHGLQKISNKVKGFDCIIDSNLQIGAGISSSAALECGMAQGINTLFELGISKDKLITISRDAEHDFVGTNCGIMDQYTVMKSKKGQLILLDCRSLQYEYIPYEINPYKIVLLNTNITHNLASSKYNKRRQECKEGVEIIQKKNPSVMSLRDVTLEMLNKHKNDIPKKVFQRCKYVIEENKRVLKAVGQLKNRNFKVLGELMYQSHEGLKNLYKVSCEELDYLIHYSKDKDEIIGSRMMGGGFGGCTINLIHKEKIDTILSDITENYKNKFKIELTYIVANSSDGVSIM